ncbi:hypothetical protein PF005_g7501 [Phytophthora fragariae]|uniref:Uncharacterized protein n=1 Tax=Phytophthora fragariae TaxID=53985 RepID=A0A6A3UN81_9STRA|nr:hypothetical protein PF009_g8258 [Phytophthora fragariae]KAE9121658.1 hypothetical protein PF007_g7743 [Phytophthora fragariae]KAE9148457.1 hypothetical protein PF006_g6955 [Phytophthora fragariae]KAE9220355.1 hypothetical protein PF005_g7501 [Phytophthora fragariae]KAE9242833.1 hypothetical protein PF002_g8541 [Phytophthora fragariae]
MEVTYRTPLDGELRAAMAAQLVKYLLFMRGQIPCLYDDLLRVVESYQLQQLQQDAENRRKRLVIGGAIKKAVKCVEAAELLFGAQLDAIFSLKVQRVALVFGSSMMSSREAVVVDFDETDAEDEDSSQTMTPPSPPMTREKLLRLCAQKLIRALHTHSMEAFSSALPATKLHIAVLAERQSSRIPGFLPKQHFKLRLPKDKGGVRTHYVTVCSGVDSNKPSQQETQHTTDTMENGLLASGSAPLELLSSTTQPAVDTTDAGMVWYVLEKPIPGFSGAIDIFGGQ